MNKGMALGHLLCHEPGSTPAAAQLVQLARALSGEIPVESRTATLVLAEPSWHRELQLAHADVPMHQQVIREAIALLPKKPSNLPLLVGPNELAVVIDHRRRARELGIWAHA